MYHAIHQHVSLRRLEIDREEIEEVLARVVTRQRTPKVFKSTGLYSLIIPTSPEAVSDQPTP